jgi:hypothetical protein
MRSKRDSVDLTHEIPLIAKTRESAIYLRTARPALSDWHRPGYLLSVTFSDLVLD